MGRLFLLGKFRHFGDRSLELFMHVGAPIVNVLPATMSVRLGGWQTTGQVALHEVLSLEFEAIKMAPSLERALALKMASGA